jgi:hypothetical protein
MKSDVTGFGLLVAVLDGFAVGGFFSLTKLGQPSFFHLFQISSLPRICLTLCKNLFPIGGVSLSNYKKSLNLKIQCKF